MTEILRREESKEMQTLLLAGEADNPLQNEIKWRRKSDTGRQKTETKDILSQHMREKRKS